MADYSCQINEYGSTDEMLRENKDGTKKNKTGKNLNENLNLYSIEIVLYFFFYYFFPPLPPDIVSPDSN